MTASGRSSSCVLAVSAHDVAVAAQPEVAVVVVFGLVRALVLAAVELDDDAAVRPEAVDGPWTDELVSERQLDLSADQQSAEAALEVALHLAMTGRVRLEDGSEVGAAGVTASERAVDVGGAEVVVELGFGEGAEEGLAVVARGEVEEGAGYRCGAEAAVVGGVGWAEAAALVEDQAFGDRSSPRHGQLGLRRGRRDDLPAPGGGPVAEEGAIACGENRGNEETVLCQQFGRDRRIDAYVDAVQSAGAQGAVDR